MSSAIIDAVDSYFLYVKQQMAIVNPSQKFGGLANARSWPVSSADSGKLYLLLLRTDEMAGSPLLALGLPSSRSQRLYQYQCQWLWVLAGADLAANQTGENRGNMYRQDMAILDSLRNANYPQYCQKNSYTSDQNGNIASTPDVGETVWWSQLTTAPKLNQDIGLTFNAAQVTVYAYSGISALVA